MSLLPPDYEDRQKAFHEFIVCPECGSEDAPTLTVDEGMGRGQITDYRMECWECGHESPWLYGKADNR